MSQTIVLITDHGLASSSRVFTGASSSVVSGVIDRTSQHGLNFLRVHADQATEEWLTDLIAARPHGVVMSCWNRPIEWQLKVLARLRAQHIPVVAWGDSPYFNDFDHLGSDHVSGTVGLVHALAAAGRKRLLRVWTIPSTVAWIAAHNQGYDTATAALQLEQIPAVYIEGFADRGQPPSERNFRIRVRQFAGHLAEHLHSANAIDAIMVGTDCEVPVAIAACRLFGRADIPVTGYDNYWDLAPEREWEPTPPFATVDKGNHLIGEELVDLLLARRSGTLPSEPQRRPIAQQIVELAR